MRSLRWGVVPLAITLAFLYLPILVVVALSFNASDSQFRWAGFSLEWYGELAANQQIIAWLGNRIVVAVGATAGSVVLGTLLAIGLHRYLRWSALDALTMGPAIAPDIVMAIGLLALYVTAGVTLGLHTVLLSHIVFGTAFVAAVVKARLGHMDPSLEEASMDLGATPLSTFFRVTVPGLLPAIVAGGLLVFTLSLDEFVIAFFTNGPATPTLPMVIYSMLRFGLTPEINALAALLLVVSFTAVIAAQRLTGLGGSDE